MKTGVPVGTAVLAVGPNAIGEHNEGGGSVAIRVNRSSSQERRLIAPSTGWKPSTGKVVYERREMPHKTRPRSRLSVASEFAIEIERLISQHPRVSTTRGGASDHARSQPRNRPRRAARQALPDASAEVRDLAAARASRDDDRRGGRAVGGRPGDDRPHPGGGQGGSARRPGQLAARREGQGAGLRTRGGPGRRSPARRGAQGDGGQTHAGGGKGRWG